MIGNTWYNNKLFGPTPSVNRQVSGIMAPRRTSEDDALMQQPGFREKYREWMGQQGPGAADWATPRKYDQWVKGGGKFPEVPANQPGMSEDIIGPSGGLEEYRKKQGYNPIPGRTLPNRPLIQKMGSIFGPNQPLVGRAWFKG